MDVRRGTDVRELCRRLGERRGRRIELVGEPLPVPGPFGYWQGRSDRDTIVFPSQASAEHQVFIVLHELSHIMLDHRLDDEHLLHRREGDENDQLRGAALAPVSSLTAGFAARWGTLQRSSYDSVIEREAEVGASLMKRWVSAMDGAGSGEADRRTRRVSDALGDEGVL